MGDQVAKPEHGRVVLAGGDRNREGRANAGEPGVVLGRPHGLLEPPQLKSLELAAHADRVFHGPRAVGVEHQLHTPAGDFPSARHRLDVDLMKLDRRVAEHERGRHGLADLGRCLVAQQARVHAGPRLAEPSEQLVDRHAPRLAGQVPERQLDAAQGHHREAATPPDHQRAMHAID